MNSDGPNGLGGPYMLEIDPAAPPRLAGLQVSNYRVLRNVQIDHLTPLAAQGPSPEEIGLNLAAIRAPCLASIPSLPRSSAFSLRSPLLLPCRPAYQ